MCHHLEVINTDGCDIFSVCWWAWMDRWMYVGNWVSLIHSGCNGGRRKSIVIINQRRLILWLDHSDLTPPQHHCSGSNTSNCAGCETRCRVTDRAWWNISVKNKRHRILFTWMDDSIFRDTYCEWVVMVFHAHLVEHAVCSLSDTDMWGLHIYVIINRKSNLGLLKTGMDLFN